MIFLEPYKKYADVSGRTARLEFFSFSIFLIVVTLILVGLDILLGTFDEANSTGLLSGLFSLFSLIPSFTVTARRLHDIDRSAWWMLILFIPLIGLIWFMVIVSFDSTAGDNRFGKNLQK